MSFSASTCLTYTGNTSLGNTLYFFSDIDSYTSSFGSVSTNLIIGGNCPYIIPGIPDGTQYIELRDYDSSCCVTFPVQSNDLCITCNLEFNILSATTVGQIVAGNLMTTCEDEVADYVINWYGPNSSTNVGYTSGKGTQFSYQFQHPLTGTSAILAQSGTYIPVIDKIISNGVPFSQTGGTGYYQANLDCFSSITVSSLTCDNGNTPTSAYTHFYSFSGASQGQQSPPLQATFDLDPTTNYFAYAFRGYSVPDNLKIYYQGTGFTNPIVMENITVGAELTSSNLLVTTFNKSADTLTNWSKVICLTGLTRSPGDEYLIIEITPNTGLTNWDLYLRCLNTFDCDTCFQDYKDTPYKIIASGVTSYTYNASSTIVPFSASCSVRGRLLISGCSSSEFYQTDTYKYNQMTALGTGTSVISPSNVFNNINSLGGIMYWSGSNCTYTTPGPSISNYSCVSPTESTINYKKYVSGSCPSCIGVIYFEFSDISDLTTYYGSYLSAMTSNTYWGFSGCSSTSGDTFGGSVLVSGPNYYGGPFSGGTSINNIPSYNDPTDTRYYRALWLVIPTATGTTNCGTNTGGEGGGGAIGNFGGGLLQGWRIHPSSVVTTGITGSNYYMQIIMSTITTGKTFSQCAINCSDYAKNIVTNVNSDSTGSSTNYSAITTTGSHFLYPFGNPNSASNGLSVYELCQSITSSTVSGNYFPFEYSFQTVPFSSDGVTILTQYSASTCQGYGLLGSTPKQFTQWLFFYKMELIGSDSDAFNIYTQGITNGALDGVSTLIGLYSAGTVTQYDSNYFV